MQIEATPNPTLTPLLLLGRRRGRGMRRWFAQETSLQRGINLIDHSLRILLNFSAGKSNDFDPLCVEPFGSCSVLRDSLRSEMRLAIAFDA